MMTARLQLPTPIDDYLPRRPLVPPYANKDKARPPVRSWVPTETLPLVWCDTCNGGDVAHDGSPGCGSCEGGANELRPGDRVDLTNTEACEGCKANDGHLCGACHDGWTTDVVGSATTTNIVNVYTEEDIPVDSWDEDTELYTVYISEEMTHDGPQYFLWDSDGDATALPGDWSPPVAFGVELGDVEAL